jgi:hypothetical protein
VAPGEPRERISAIFSLARARAKNTRHPENTQRNMRPGFNHGPPMSGQCIYGVVYYYATCHPYLMVVIGQCQEKTKHKPNRQNADRQHRESL